MEYKSKDVRRYITLEFEEKDITALVQEMETLITENDHKYKNDRKELKAMNEFVLVLRSAIGIIVHG